MIPQRLTSPARRAPEAERSDGIVYVVLPDRTSFETVDATPDRTAIATATRQLEAIRDEWLAPLVAQISEQAETLGRVTAERDQAQHERDELRRRAHRANTQQEISILEREQIVAEREALRAARDTLEQRVRELETQQAESRTQASSAAQTAIHDATIVHFVAA